MCKVLMRFTDDRMQELETIVQKSPEKHLEAATTRTIEAISHGGQHPLCVCGRVRSFYHFWVFVLLAPVQCFPCSLCCW